MGQEFKVAGWSGLPTSARHSARGRQINKTFNNLKTTVLCGFVTILVLRGTIGVGNLGGASPSADDQKVVEDIERILREIRSDSEPDDPAAANVTLATSVYTLGPKISGRDRQRRRWLGQNPGFPNRIRGGKAQILLVTGSPPNPCDNPMGDHYLLKSTKNKIDYCRIPKLLVAETCCCLSFGGSDKGKGST